jgi:hypothetical protein
LKEIPPVLVTKRFLTSGVLCAAIACSFLLGPVVALPTAANAAAVRIEKAKGEHKGKVVNVDATAGSITIEHGKKGPKTFTVSKDTKISVDGVSGKALSDVTSDMKVKIETAKKSTAALSIDATMKKAKKKK